MSWAVAPSLLIYFLIVLGEILLYIFVIACKTQVLLSLPFNSTFSPYIRHIFNGLPFNTILSKDNLVSFLVINDISKSVV